MKSAFTISLDAKAEDEDVELRVRIGCPVLEDDDQEGDDLALMVDVNGVKAVVDKADPHLYRFPLVKGTKAHFKIESESYNPAWTVRLRPEIDREIAQ